MESNGRSGRGGLSGGRRGFLRAMGLGVAAPAVSAGAAVAGGGEGEAKNVIFFVSDGMNVGTLSLTDLFSREILGRPDPWVRLYREQPETRRALMDMASANSPVTDSAAAASAWSSGRLVGNGSVNYCLDGKRLAPILETVVKGGKAAGLVTTARVTHATPAGFGAAVPGRGEEDAIALQYRENGIDVVLGGGLPHFQGGKRKDGLDLVARYRADGYRVVRGRKGLLEAGDAERVLGLFSDGHMPYELDRLHSGRLQRSVPSLAEMTRVALGVLGRKAGGFVMQVEGARVDHAGHLNDLGAILHEQVAFGEALQVGLDYAAGRDDTLVVVCTDHGCGGPNLNGAGPGYLESGERFARIRTARRSLEGIAGVLNGRDGSAAEDCVDIVGSSLGVELEIEERAAVAGLLGRLRGEGTNFTPENLMGVLAPVQNGRCSVGWNGIEHTGELVEIAAVGPGACGLPAHLRGAEVRAWLLGAMGMA